jgi:hypothetical protein
MISTKESAMALQKNLRNTETKLFRNAEDMTTDLDDIYNEYMQQGVPPANAVKNIWAAYQDVHEPGDSMSVVMGDFVKYLLVMLYLGKEDKEKLDARTTFSVYKRHMLKQMFVLALPAELPEQKRDVDHFNFLISKKFQKILSST